jgi:hypothetical protein
MQVEVTVPRGVRGTALAVVRTRQDVWMTSSRDVGSDLADTTKHRVIRTIDVWHLSEDIDVILAAEEAHLVSTMEEAAEIAAERGATETSQSWVGANELQDPPGTCHYPNKYARDHNYSRLTVWREPLCEEVAADDLQATLERRGQLYERFAHGNRAQNLKDIRSKQVRVWMKLASTTAELSDWAWEHTHVPGIDKRRASRKASGQKRKTESLPTQRDLKELLERMSYVCFDEIEIRMDVKKKKYGKRLDTAGLKAAIEKVMNIQRAIGSPWVSCTRGARQRKVLAEKRERLMGEGEDFWTKLALYMDELTPTEESA